MNIESTANMDEVIVDPTPDLKAKPTGVWKWIPLIVMSMAIMIIVIDTTILNVSLRTIINDLHTNIQSIQWVITAYSLMLAAFTITGGRLGDLFGRKRMFVVGAVIFAIGSFMASTSHGVAQMILGEAIIEGIGAALMMPATTSLLVSTYQGRDRQIGFGVWGGIAAASAALGPVFGGWLTTHYSWRWAFRINVFVAAALVLASILIKESMDREEKHSLDFVGIILSVLGMLSLVFGFIQSSTYGWWKVNQPLVWLHHTLNLGQLSATPVFILLGVIILGLFILWESYMVRKGRTPLVSLKLFRNSQFVVGASITGVLSIGLAGLTFAIPVFFQGVRNLNALDTGVAMLPLSLAIMLLAPLSAAFSKYISPKVLIMIGLSLNIIGFFVLRQSIHVDSTAWALAPGFILFGAGMGMIFAQSNNITLSAVSVQESGEASGVNNTFRQLGQTLGAAILGSILIISLGSALVSGVNSSQVIPAQLKSTISQNVAAQASNIEFGTAASSTSAVPPAITAEIKAISEDSTVKAAKNVLLYGGLVMILGLLISFLLPNSKNMELGMSAAAADPETTIQTMPKELPATGPPAKSSRRFGGVIVALVLLAAGLSIGYAWGNSRQKPALMPTSVDTQTDSMTGGSNSAPDTAVPNPAPAPAATPASTPAATPAPVSAPVSTRIYQNSNLHFSLTLPTDWQIQESDSQVVLIDPQNDRFSIQSYAVTDNDYDDLIAYLNQQSNLRAVYKTGFAGYQAGGFAVDGFYHTGYAFLNSGRLYYVLGTSDPAQSILAQLTVQ